MSPPVIHGNVIAATVMTPDQLNLTFRATSECPSPGFEVWVYVDGAPQPLRLPAPNADAASDLVDSFDPERVKAKEKAAAEAEKQAKADARKKAETEKD